MYFTNNQPDLRFSWRDIVPDDDTIDSAEEAEDLADEAVDNL